MALKELKVKPDLIIVDALDKASVIVEDILFELDNK